MQQSPAASEFLIAKLPAGFAMAVGGVSKLSNTQEIISVVSKVSDSQVMADLDAAAGWAGKSGKGDTGRLGITGFCGGGRIIRLYAAYSPKLKAGVAWYGRLSGAKSELPPRHPIDDAASLKAPVLGCMAGKTLAFHSIRWNKCAQL